MWVMNCQDIEFSPDKSRERITKALLVFQPKLLSRILAFSLYLLGAKRQCVADLVGMPNESVKTAVRVVFRDGFPAFRDRRYTKENKRSTDSSTDLHTSVCCDNNCYVIRFGLMKNEIRIPLEHKIKARTVLLSLLNAGMLSITQVAEVLGLSYSHCRELAGKLSDHDVEETLVDKRRGQKQDYRIGSEKKASIIQLFAARVVTGQHVSGNVLAGILNEDSDMTWSPRTVRWHMKKLGLNRIKKTLPALVCALKKTL